MKENLFITVVGIMGAYISSVFGGWDSSLTTLIVFMSVDYVTGLIVAGVFKSSPKTKTGALESRAGYKGLFRKGMILLMVLIATRLDIIMETHFVRDAVVIAYIVNEGISIVENAGLMGIPVPSAIIKAIDILRRKSDEKNTIKREAGLEKKMR